MTNDTDAGAVGLLAERLRNCTDTPDWVKAPWRDIYPETRREEIESFIYSISRDRADATPFPLIYVAQMLSTISSMAPPQGSHHHATFLAAETVLFYADLIARLTNPAEPSEAMIDAGVRTHGGHKNIGEQVRAIYLSMERERLAMTKGGGE